MFKSHIVLTGIAVVLTSAAVESLADVSSAEQQLDAIIAEHWDYSLLT